MPSYQPAHGTLYLEYLIQHISIPNFTKIQRKVTVYLNLTYKFTQVLLIPLLC
jgi:hypothetical protein